eukprot:Nk52_evm1s2010 gene=Nk52_evmTU1s2010
MAGMGGANLLGSVLDCKEEGDESLTCLGNVTGEGGGNDQIGGDTSELIRTQQEEINILRVQVDALKAELRNRDVAAGVCAEDGSDAMRERAKEEELVDVENDSLTEQTVGIEDQDMAGEKKIDYAKRARWVPLRLCYEERRYLRLVDAAMEVSDYTGKVDVFSHRSARHRKVAQIKEVCACLLGLLLADDFAEGQRRVKDRDLEANADFFEGVFEIMRRYKIMNPEKMRSTYGKLMCLLQDAQDPQIKDLLGFSVHRPIQTVDTFLQRTNCASLLQEEELLQVACQEIYPPPGMPRYEVNKLINQKNKAVKILAEKYGKSSGSSSGSYFSSVFFRGTSKNEESVKESLASVDEIEQCVFSLSDEAVFLRYNSRPCYVLMEYLQTHFGKVRSERNEGEAEGHPRTIDIHYGRSGARLTHSHERQYSFVLQTLMLWTSILNAMFELWIKAEQDLLDPENPYRLRDTGQGLNRVQSCPRVSRKMHNILCAAQRNIGSWVGSSVIHLGDHAVPNALVFLDKYTQIQRILNPVVITLTRCTELYASGGLGNSGLKGFRGWIDREYGGNCETLKLDILQDLFRHGFDGSGADNFYDAGSCIDGRLTSLWNWANTIGKKPFYPVFLLTGFKSFDGEFN